MRLMRRDSTKMRVGLYNAHYFLQIRVLREPKLHGEFGNGQLKATDLIRSCEKFAGSRCPYSSILPFTDPPSA